MKTKSELIKQWWALAAAAALMAGAAGCSSHPKKEAQVSESADLSEDNQLLIRMAFAENVYNGTAAERAVYANDFVRGTAVLNELGAHRVRTLADACRGAKGHVTVVRGEEDDALYADRIAAVRHELADAGLDPDDMTVAKGGLVGGGVTSSDRVVVTFKKMVTDETAAPRSGSGSSGSSMQSSSGSAGSGFDSNQKGQ
jgi:hypothetical protein